MILGGLAGVSILVFFIRRSIPNWLRGFALLLVVLYDTAIWINMFPVMVNIAPSCATLPFILIRSLLIRSPVSSHFCVAPLTLPSGSHRSSMRSL
jgi:uncharacterized membrane protein